MEKAKLRPHQESETTEEQDCEDDECSDTLLSDSEFEEVYRMARKHKQAMERKLKQDKGQKRTNAQESTQSYRVQFTGSIQPQEQKEVESMSLRKRSIDGYHRIGPPRRDSDAALTEDPMMMAPLLQKGPDAEERYVPWNFMDMQGMINRLPALTDGADKWIAAFEESPGGITQYMLLYYIQRTLRSTYWEETFCVH